MYHNVIIVGHLGGDPEMRYLTSGQPVTTFSVASTRRYTSQSNEQVDETVWFRISVFGKQAENCNAYLKKGSLVLIEGRLRPDTQTGGPRTFTRKDGSSGASYEITANTVRFLSSKSIDTDESTIVTEDSDSIPF
jgi:single-strand DNA-binding protein